MIRTMLKDYFGRAYGLFHTNEGKESRILTPKEILAENTEDKVVFFEGNQVISERDGYPDTPLYTRL